MRSLTTRLLMTVLVASALAVALGGAGSPDPASAAIDPPERSPTQIVLGSSPNPSIFGQSVTFTATVTDDVGTPTGTVCFLAGATELGTGILDGSGVATLTTSMLDAGSYVIIAVYEGDSSFQGSTSGTVLQVVNQASTSTTVTSSANPSILGQPVTFTATVTDDGGTPTGTVTFLDGVADLGTAPLVGDGQATVTTDALTIGTHPITAQYNGDPNFAGSTSAPLIQTVLDEAIGSDDLVYLDVLDQETDDIELFEPSNATQNRIRGNQIAIRVLDALIADLANRPDPRFQLVLGRLGRARDLALARLEGLVPADARYAVAGPGTVDVQATLTSRNAAGDAIESHPLRVTAQALNGRSGPIVPVRAGGRIASGLVGGILFVGAQPGGSLLTQADGYGDAVAPVVLP